MTLQDDKKESVSIDNFFRIDSETSFKERVAQLAKNHLKKENICQGSGLETLLKHFHACSLPEEGWSMDEFLDEIADVVLPHTTNTGSPYFIGHMTSMLPDFIRPLAELIASTNQNIVKVETAKAPTLYERQALSMLHEVIYKRGKDFYQQNIHAAESTFGIITSGGTVANMTALQCARNKSLSDSDVNVEQDGFTSALLHHGYKKSVVIGSELGHYSLEKAMGLLGMGSKNFLELQTDSNKKISLPLLRKTLEDCQRDNIHVTAIVGIAGATESGTIDPLEEMADLAAEFNVHFHVDAAWGGALLFSDRHKALLRGIERADSVTIDGHKQLYLPMGIGMVMFKDPQLAETIEKQANYIIRRDSFDLGKRSIEGSRPANMFYLQAAFKVLGRKGFEELIDRGMERTAEFVEIIKDQPMFELLLKPESNILLYRCLPQKYYGQSVFSADENQEIDNFNILLQKRQRERGISFVSRTSMQIDRIGPEKVVTLRVVLANPLTQEKHLRSIIKEQIMIAEDLNLEM